MASPNTIATRNIGLISATRYVKSNKTGKSSLITRLFPKHEIGKVVTQHANKPLSRRDKHRAEVAEQRGQ